VHEVPLPPHNSVKKYYRDLLLRSIIFGIWKEKYNLESCELKTKLLPIKIEELLQVS
jgi:hypothetical protein